MNNINSVAVSGNVTYADYTQGRLVFGIASNESRKQQDGTWGNYANFFECVVFGKRADGIKPYINKGTRVFVSGKLAYSAWKDKSGQQRSKVNIHVSNIEFSSPRNQQQRQQQRQQQPAQQQMQAEPYAQDDLPF